MESPSPELYGVPWHKVRFEEMLRLLELNRVHGEMKLKEFQQRRAKVKERQDFLQKRRVTRLRMEGIIIDLESVKRRCKAPKESLWYEDVGEAEKQKLMKKRLKEMFKTQYFVRCIEERSDSSSDESAEDKPEEKPQRGQLLRNYTKMYKKSQDRPTASEKESNTSNQGDANHESSHSETFVANKESNTKVNNISLTDKKPASGRFRKAAARVTSVTRISGSSGSQPVRKSISPVTRVANLSATSRNSSAGKLRSPSLPRISSGGSKK